MTGRPVPRVRISRWALAAICAAFVAASVALFVAWRIDQHADMTMPQATCGTVVTHLLTDHTQLLQAYHGALTCFSAAARKCRSASIAVWEMGVDAGTSYVFSIDPGGTACQATQLSQDRGFNFGGSLSQITTTQCPKITATGNGVNLHCGGADVLIPATLS